MYIKITGQSKNDLELLLSGLRRPRDEMPLSEALLVWATDHMYPAHFAARRLLQLEAMERGADPASLPAALNPAGRTIDEQLLFEAFESAKSRYMSAMTEMGEVFRARADAIRSSEGIDAAIDFIVRQAPDSAWKVWTLNHFMRERDREQAAEESAQ